jgi:hypothetical protein
MGLKGAVRADPRRLHVGFKGVSGAVRAGPGDLIVKLMLWSSKVGDF